MIVKIIQLYKKIMCKKLNICFLGDKCVGKTSTIHTMVNSFFDEEKYSPTIESKFNKLFSYKILYNLNIHDTAGSIEMESLLLDTIKQCDCFVIMYSITDRDSYDSIYKYRDLIKEAFPYKENIPIILCANKNDHKKQSQFSQNEIIDISKSFGLPSTISSAKCLNSVLNTFKLLLDIVQKYEKQVKKDKKKYEKNLKKTEKLELEKKKSIFEQVLLQIKYHKLILNKIIN
ncbi:hypothetical protein RB653_010538 [Dictyostelium firmibasis]|uniref:Small GTPase n=1 Tax=Dictyostelium firmibasis TaxID=79012 RepID=A0AAN7YN24_9MYCE